MLTRFTRLFAYALWASLPMAASAQFAFSGPATYAPGDRPDGVAFGDFNGDGLSDMAVSSANPNKVAIFRNLGGGTFGAPDLVETGAGTGADDLAAADVDGDGDTDLVVTLHNAAAVRVLLNGGSGAFSLGASVAVGANPISIAAGDFNGDGRPDLATANRDANSVSVLLNQGGGAFSSASIGVNLDPRGVAAGDFDGDGDLDIVASNHDSRNLTVLWNSGSGTFMRGPDLSVGSSVRPESVVAGDLDRDGDGDIVVAVNGNGQNFIAVFTGSAGSFSGPLFYGTGGANPAHLTLGDFDCDGDMDVAVANETSNALAVMANNGAGAFGAPTLLATGSQPEDVAAADLDGDTDLEIGIANQGSNTVSVYKNETCTSNVILPSAFTITRGVLQSGGLADLFNSDDSYLNVEARRPTEVAAASVEIVVEGISPTEAPASLTLTFEGSTSGSPVSQRIEVYNFHTSTWETVDERDGQSTDSTVQIILNDAARYVQTGSGTVRARIGYHDRGVTYPAWGSRFDLVRWTIG